MTYIIPNIISGITFAVVLTCAVEKLRANAGGSGWNT